MDIPGFYRVKDPIQNFRVRVSIKCVQEGKKPRGENDEDGGDWGDKETEDRGEEREEENEEDESDESEDEENDSDSDNENRRRNKQSKKKGKKVTDKKRKDEEQRRQREWTESFTWQEKKFGPRELVKYLTAEGGEGALGKTAIEAEYREQIRRRCRYGEDLLENISQVMLFTYTDKDGFVPKNELTKFVTTSEEFVLNSVAESIVTIPETGGRMVHGENSFGASEDAIAETNENTGVYGGDDGDYASLRNQKRGNNHNEVSAGQRLFRESPFKVFYIMAAVDVETGALHAIRRDKFQQKDQDQEDESIPFFKKQGADGRKFYEVVLCTVKVNREGSLMEMKPGFSKSRHLGRSSSPPLGEQNKDDGTKWYRFTTPQGSVYEYSLVNEADSTDPLLENEINTIQREATEKKIAALEGRVSNMLLNGPVERREVVYHVFLEIVSLDGFVDACSDLLYVQYEICLPANKRWRWMSTSNPLHKPTGSEKDANFPLRGVTQTSKCRYVRKTKTKEYLRLLGQASEQQDESFDDNLEYVAHFAFPIELQMVHIESEEGDDNLVLTQHEMPRVYFQIKSRDTWERHRAEGYAHIALPSECGSAEYHVKTWKVAGSLRQQASEYYIGGALQLESSSYTFVPQSHQGPFLNRYGFRSESSGSLRVRVHTAAHSYVDPTVSADLDRQEKNRRKNGIQDPILATGSERTHQVGSQARRRTVSEILNSLKFGRKITKTSQETPGSDKSSDLLASLNRVRAQRANSAPQTDDRANEDSDKE